MPTYDFHCSKCGRNWEDVVSFSERHRVRCCNRQAQVIPSFRGKVELIGGIFGYDEHMDHHPVRVKNRADRKRQAAERGLGIRDGG